jgi:hypothetical protein
MARRDTKPRDPSARQPAAPLPIVNPNAAAIDVHADNHVVCVPADRDSPNVRTFGANSCDLLQIADWLKRFGITTVAIESTGVYWIPIQTRNHGTTPPYGRELPPGRTRKRGS